MKKYFLFILQALLIVFILCILFLIIGMINNDIYGYNKEIFRYIACVGISYFGIRVFDDYRKQKENAEKDVD